MSSPRHQRSWNRAAALAALALALSFAPAAWADDSGELREEVFRRIDRGVAALRQGDAIKAREDLCWAYGRALNNHSAAWYCGRAALLSRQPELAVESLELAVELEPEHLGSGVDLGHAYLALGDPPRARATFFKVLEVREDHSPAWTGLARVAALTGDEERALELYEKALEANAADAKARLARGELHLAAGRLDQALDDIREAARLRPDDAAVQLGLTRILLRTRLFDEALAAARQAQRLNPASPSVFAMTAEVYLSLDALPEAEEKARKALRLDRGHPRARVALAAVYGRTGRLEEALELLEARDEDEFLLPDEATRLREARERWTGYRDNLARLESAAGAEDATARDLVDLAKVRLATGEKERALALLERAHAKGAEDAALLRDGAWILGQSGRMIESERWLVRLVAMDEAEARDLVNLGVARERSGDPAGAAASFAQALERARGAAPGDPAAIAAQGGLARIAAARGETEAAIGALEAFIELGPSEEAATRARAAIERLRSGGR